MSGTHARLSASAAHRWLVCPGSADGVSKSSRYAAEGTFAHEIAAQCMRADKPAIAFVGHKGSAEGFDFECDVEMAAAIQVYRDAILEDLQPGDQVGIEIPLTMLTQLDPDFGGTADFARYRPSTRSLRVFDYKHGSGVFVDVVSNEQEMMYALGAYLKAVNVGVQIEEIELTVVQPRFEGAEPVRSWKFKAYEFLDFVADIKEAAVRTREPNPPRIPGDHCKFCNHERTCPELAARQTALVAMQMTSMVDVATVSKALADIPVVKARIHAIEEYAYAQAMKGVNFPGWKLVEKRPTRRWKSEGDTIEWAQANAIDPFAPRELLSPKQLEDKLKAEAPRGKKTAAAEALAPLTHKVSSGLALVPVTDDRDPIKRVTAADFKTIN